MYYFSNPTDVTIRTVRRHHLNFPPNESIIWLFSGRPAVEKVDIDMGGSGGYRLYELSAVRD